LGYGKQRKGPNKAVSFGIVQPILDGVKLFIKGLAGRLRSLRVVQAGIPAIGLVGALTLGVRVIIAGVGDGVIGYQTVVLVLLVGAFVSLSYFFAGLLRGGFYGIVGRVRALALCVTYEGVIMGSILGIGLCQYSISIFSIENTSVLFIFLLSLLLVAVVMEGRRSPVDFVEGESELVSGLATEFAGVEFRLVFIVEYGLICVYSSVLALVVRGGL